MLKPMLYQACRPSSIDGYVFVDSNMEKKVKEWIKEKTIPHLILSGSPGVGKCLDGKERVDVYINGLNESEENLLEKYKFPNTKSNSYSIPIKMLFYVLGLQDVEYELPVTPTKEVFIWAPNGYVPVRGLVRKHHEIHEFLLEDQTTFRCSNQHIVFKNNDPILIMDTDTLDTVNGPKRIIRKEFVDYGDVYDVVLDAPHQYVTPNGIIHHNTTLAYILCNELEIDPTDIKYVKASLDRGIEHIRDVIVPFVESAASTENGRIVIMDEFDKLTADAQDSLRNILEDCMEDARFIFTANYPHKIIDAMFSRCQAYHIDELDVGTYKLRIAEQLVERGISFDMPTLDHYVDKHYPDMRRVYNDIERFTFDNVLTIIKSKSDNNHKEWMVKSINMIMNNEHREARELICSNITYHEYDDFYRLMYENVDWWADGDNMKRDKAIIAIKDHMVDDRSVGDREIVLSSCLATLSLLKEK